MLASSGVRSGGTRGDRNGETHVDRAGSRVPRVLVVSEIPTPYRLPFFRRLAESGRVELEVLFCARSEPDRPWQLDHELDTVPHRFLRGLAPTFRTRRNTFVYQLNPGVVPLLARRQLDVVVVGGYSVFAEQAAIVIAGLRRIPYIVHSESTLTAPRTAPVRALKQIGLRPVIGRAAAGLATGSEAARYLEHYGLPRERIRIVPNTIDVARYRMLAAQARARDADLRDSRGLPEHFVLFAGRLVEDKGITDLLEARRQLGAEALPLVVAGEGPLAGEVAGQPGVVSLGFVEPEALVELYALAEWTVVPSRREPWGVVVNEALASGCPVIASSAVGAGADLLQDGVNGRIVPERSPAALAAALAGPPPSGEPDRGAIEGWTHDYAVAQFLEAVEIAIDTRRGAAAC